MAPTRDQGFSFGFTDPSFRNVHLTVYFSPKDRRLHTHISDPSVKQFPWSQQIDPRLFNEMIWRLTKSWTVSMDKVASVYVMRPRLLRSFSKTLPKAVDEMTAEFPVEAFSTKLRLDLHNPFRWRRVRSGDLADNKPRFGYVIVKGVAKVVIPHPNLEGKLLWYSEGQWGRFQSKIARLVGAEMFTDYLETRKVGDEYVRAVRARLRRRD